MRPKEQFLQQHLPRPPTFNFKQLFILQTFAEHLLRAGQCSGPGPGSRRFKLCKPHAVSVLYSSSFSPACCVSGPHKKTQTWPPPSKSDGKRAEWSKEKKGGRAEERQAKAMRAHWRPCTACRVGRAQWAPGEGASGRKSCACRADEAGEKGKKYGPGRRHQVDLRCMRPGERQGCGPCWTGLGLGVEGAELLRGVRGGGRMLGHQPGPEESHWTCVCPKGGCRDFRREEMGLDLSGDVEVCHPLLGKSEARRKVLVP